MISLLLCNIAKVNPLYIVAIQRERSPQIVLRSKTDLEKNDPRKYRFDCCLKIKKIDWNASSSTKRRKAACTSSGKQKRRLLSPEIVLLGPREEQLRNKQMAERRTAVTPLGRSGCMIFTNILIILLTR